MPKLRRSFELTLGDISVRAAYDPGDTTAHVSVASSYEISTAHTADLSAAELRTLADYLLLMAGEME